MARYELLADCFIDDAHHRRGTIIERPDDWHGPHKTVMESQLVLHADNLDKARDVPLYRKLRDDEP